MNVRTAERSVVATSSAPRRKSTTRIPAIHGMGEAYHAVRIAPLA